MLCPYRERVGVMAGDESTEEMFVDLREEMDDVLEEGEEE